LTSDHRQRFQTDPAVCKSERRSSTCHPPWPGNAPSRGTTGRNRGCNGRQRDVSTHPSQSAVARVHTVMTHSSLLCHGFGLVLWVHWARVVTYLQRFWIRFVGALGKSGYIPSTVLDWFCGCSGQEWLHTFISCALSLMLPSSLNSKGSK